MKCKDCGHDEEEHRPSWCYGYETNTKIGDCECKKFKGEDLKYCLNCLPDGNPSDECKIEGHKYSYPKKQGCGKHIWKNTSKQSCPECQYNSPLDDKDKDPEAFHHLYFHHKLHINSFPYPR